VHVCSIYYYVLPDYSRRLQVTKRDEASFGFYVYLETLLFWLCFIDLHVKYFILRFYLVLIGDNEVVCLFYRRYFLNYLTMSEFLQNYSTLMKYLCFILLKLSKYELGCEMRDSMKLNQTCHS
jgi:hypothetical protein